MVRATLEGRGNLSGGATRAAFSSRCLRVAPALRCTGAYLQRFDRSTAFVSSKRDVSRPQVLLLGGEHRLPDVDRQKNLCSESK